MTLNSSDAYPKNGLLIGCTLVDLNHEVLSVHVMIMTTGTRNIKKGSDLAECDQVDEVVTADTQPPVSSNRLRELPDHVEDLYERSLKNFSITQQEELSR